MRADLVHAQASIDWAVSQFPSFDERIDVWCQTNVKIAIRDPDPNVPNNVIVAEEKEPLPLAFMVETGAYINAIRSSLDILATTLANRYGVPKPQEAYFPVVPTEREFTAGNYKGSDLVKGLPDIERARIEALKPYKGGNQTLWALHRLDIMRKHKRLLEVTAQPRWFAITGWGIRDAYTPLATWIGGDGETVLGLLAKGTKAQVQMSPYVAINEPSLLDRMPVIEALKKFASLATSIVAMFDDS